MSIRNLVDRRAVTFVEEALADFINGGHYARHLRRSSKIVKKNRDALVKGLKSGKEKNLMHLTPLRQGLHLALLLDKNINDVTLEAKLQKPELQFVQYRVIAGMHKETACLWAIAAFHPNFMTKQAKRFPISSVITNNCDRLFLTSANIMAAKSRMQITEGFKTGLRAVLLKFAKQNSSECRSYGERPEKCIVLFPRISGIHLPMFSGLSSNFQGNKEC